MSATASANLIDAQTLRSCIDDQRVRVFDCRFSLTDASYGAKVYAEGHVPGAHCAHLDAHLSSSITPETGRHPLPDPQVLAGWLGRCGVTERSEVVVYDDTGGTFAVRLWWLLRWLGHDRVSLLDGGFRAWVEAGGEVSTDAPASGAGKLPVRLRNETWISSRDLMAELDAGSILLIDARSSERFRGEVEPLDSVAGHIPGSINLPLSDNLDATGRFLPAATLRERFLAAMGDVPSERVVHGCGSGVTACHNLLAMEVAGLSGSRLYAGSWSEWIRSPDRPIATGP